MSDLCAFCFEISPRKCPVHAVDNYCPHCGAELTDDMWCIECEKDREQGKLEKPR